jgi:tRNA threonylcarbamoyladenosine biosynthesis protein TsaE
LESLFNQEAELSEISSIANTICKFLNQYPILLLKGELGTGKTTLTQQILKSLEYSDAVNSPTFNIVNEYKINVDKTVFHFDLYRIKNERELDELGFIEYIDSGNICIIEWPEIAMNYFDTEYLELQIHHLNNKRHYELNLINHS